MTTTQGVANPMDMTDEQRSVLKTVEKLLRLAGHNTNEAEAAAAAAKAQDLLLAYNLSSAAIGSSDEGRRGQEKLTGGFYQYERDLMSAVAEINFCLHWVSRDWVPRPENEQKHAKVLAFRSRWRQKHIQRHQHHLVGRLVAVRTTEFTMGYLMQTIERLTRDFVSQGLPRSAEDTVVGLSAALRSRRAVNFREGVAESVCDRLWERRRDQLAEERRKERAAEALRTAGATGEVSSSTAVTISSVRQTEHDANMDVLYGEGWSARQRAAAAERAQKRKEAEEAYTRWAAEHPEEAAAEEKKRREEERKSSRRRWSGGPGSRGGRTREDYRDEGAFAAGREAGKTVGLDPQTEHKSAPRKIAGRV